MSGSRQRVTISGMVFDPNEYRLVPDMKVRDLIDAAGGLQKNAYLRTAEITRRHISQDGMTTEKIEINLEKAIAGDPENNIALRDYDYLVIRPIPDLQFDLTAEIAGEVRFPGMYPIQKQETLSSLIERAGGYTDQAYLRGAVFTRKSAMEVQRRRLDELVQQIEESMLSKRPGVDQRGARCPGRASRAGGSGGEEGASGKTAVRRDHGPRGGAADLPGGVQGIEVRYRAGGRR